MERQFKDDCDNQSIELHQMHSSKRKKNAQSSTKTPISTQCKLRIEEREQDEKESTLYRLHVCSTMFAAILSFPDVACAANVTVRFMSKLGAHHKKQ